MHNIIKVGSGFGFLVHGKEPYIITAAANVPERESDPHFEPENEEEAAALVEDDEESEDFYQKILGAFDGPQNVAAICIYRDSYIVVLACTKSHHFPYEKVKFSDLISRVKPLQITKPPKPQPGDLGIFYKAKMISPEGVKDSVDVLCQGKIAWVINNVPSPGSLGSPILFDDKAIGLIVTATGLNDSLAGGLRRFLHGNPGDKRGSRLPKLIFHEGGINPFLADGSSITSMSWG